MSLLGKSRSAIVSFLICTVISPNLLSASETEKEEKGDFVTVAGQEIPVRYEPDRPIVGLDMDKIIRDDLPDSDLFQGRIDMPAPWGIAHTWSIPKPHYTTWEGMRAAWSMNRDPRGIALMVGVFRSHRDALRAADSHFKSVQGVVGPGSFSVEDPGYVAWAFDDPSIPRFFVRDNVFVYVEAISEDLNPAAIVQGFDRDLKNGADGVLRGEKVEPPTIEDPGFPYSFSIAAKDRAFARLGAKDPNDRKVWRVMWVQSDDRPRPIPNTEYNYPDPPWFSWKESGEVEIMPRGVGAMTVELRAVAVNDLCVVSDVWSKSVRFSVARSLEQ
ncbi:MAG: hypothetical protein ABIH23_12965 [bacterium]